MTTVEPPIKDPPRGGHNRNSLFTKDTLKSPKRFLILLRRFEPLKSGQPLYKGQNGWPQHFLHSQVPLYTVFHCSSRTLSLGGELHVHVHVVSM